MSEGSRLGEEENGCGEKGSMADVLQAGVRES